MYARFANEAIFYLRVLAHFNIMTLTHLSLSAVDPHTHALTNASVSSVRFVSAKYEDA